MIPIDSTLGIYGDLRDSVQDNNYSAVTVVFKFLSISDDCSEGLNLNLYICESLLQIKKLPSESFLKCDFYDTVIFTFLDFR